MLINSLEKMEQIVSKNRSLKWDGWTVVQKESQMDISKVVEMGSEKVEKLEK